MSLNIIILAAGQGTRMKTSLPKVLNLLGGKPLLAHVIETAQSLSPKDIYIVYGHEGEKIQSVFSEYSQLKWIYQEKQEGTAHAVMQVLPNLSKLDDQVLILYGDVPLISSETLSTLIQKTSKDQLGLLTAYRENPFGLGRIIRKNKKVIQIIEEKEADNEQKKITEINPGIYLAAVKNLKNWLSLIQASNQQKEFYLTDIVQEDRDIIDIAVENYYEVYGVNDLQQLYELECYYQSEIAKKFRLEGIHIGANVIFEGDVKIGKGSQIGDHCILRNVNIGCDTEIKPYSLMEESHIGDHCKVGPFARTRPGTVLKNNAAIGNFVEVKNSVIGEKSKIPHLSYIGDTVIGNNVNVGAGVIICNYDGISKHQTVIEDDVFIGSDSQLVAPVVIEKGAYIGTGSTITKNAPAHKLTLARARQQTIDRWKRPLKEEK